jgi:hypothetical protein
MAKIASDIRASSSRIEEKLTTIKGNVSDWHDYFCDNFKRYHDGRKFVFESSLSSQDLDILRETGKPQLEFNILEAYLSRLRGEFSKQEPTLSVYSRPTAKDKMTPDLIDFLEMYLRALILDANKDNMQYNVFTDTLSGGFSCLKVFTDYLNEESFDQDIFIKRTFDPTLIVFDKMARESHKGDGRFSGELFPKTYDEVKSKYGGDAVTKIRFDKADSFGDFRWSYSTESGEEIILLCDYYEKKNKKAKIVQVAAMGDFPSQVMLEKDYEKFAEKWQMERIEQVPAVIAKRATEIQSIDRYILCGDKILEHHPTDWRYLPHIFVDGNSMDMRKETEGASYQLCRPFLYHAKGIQRLKNYSGICLANALENMTQHKFMMAVESVPPQYTDALTDVQRASVVLYYAYDQDNPDKQLPMPTTAPNAPIPPEITQTFSMTDQMTQTILGSYDASLGINDNQLSGKAISNGAMQSNPVALPFIVNYMKAMNQVGVICLDLIPKYMKTPRSVPIIDKKGKRNFALINGDGQLKMEYDARSLQIDIRPGVSFEIQRSQAFQMLIQLMQINPQFQAFMNQGSGIEIILDNVDIRGIDRIKREVEAFVTEQKQKEQQIMQMQMQKAQQDQQMQAAQLQMMQKNNPADIKREELKLKAMKDGADIEIKKGQLDIDYMLAVAEIENQEIENDLREAEINARNARTDVDLITRQSEHKHTRAMDLLALHRESEEKENKSKDEEK